MRSINHAGQVDVLWEAVVIGKCRDTHTFVQVFSPLLFVLASRYPSLDAERAVGEVLEEFRAHAGTWAGSGLPIRVWTAWLALRRLEWPGGRMTEPSDPQHLKIE